MAKWNEETTTQLVTAYNAALEANKGEALSTEQLEKVASAVDTTINSARQKLVTEKVYVAPEASAKVGNPSTTRKSQIVQRIANATGLDLDSLEKGNKGELEALQAYIDNQAAILDYYENGGDEPAAEPAE